MYKKLQEVTPNSEKLTPENLKLMEALDRLYLRRKYKEAASNNFFQSAHSGKFRINQEFEQNQNLSKKCKKFGFSSSKDCIKDEEHVKNEYDCDKMSSRLSIKESDMNVCNSILMDDCSDESKGFEICKRNNNGSEKNNRKDWEKMEKEFEGEKNASFSSRSDAMKNDFRDSETRENKVVCMHRESRDMYWVMDASDLREYVSIQKILNENADSFKAIFPFEGLLCACQFNGEWYRAEIVSVKSKKIVVRFVDYGNVEECDKEFFVCKEIPQSLKEPKKLAYLVRFENGTLANCETEDLGSTLIVIEENRKSVDGSVRLVKIIDSGDDDQKEAAKRKYAVDELEVSSKGTMFLLPGPGKTRMAAIIPDNFNVHAYDMFSTDSELENSRKETEPEIRCDEDSGVAFWTDRIESDSNACERFNLTVLVTIDEEICQKRFLDGNRYRFEVTEINEKLGSRRCKLKRNGEKDLIGFVERPPAETEVFCDFLRSGSSVVISGLGWGNRIHVRKIDAKSDWKYRKFVDKLNEFAILGGEVQRSQPEVGDLCCAKCQVDESFHRCQIVSADGGNAKISVINVDSGRTGNLNLNDLIPISRNIETIPYFAADVDLAGISSEEMNFGENVTEFLRDLMDRQEELILTYEKYLEDVRLKIKKTGLSVNEFILEISTAKTEEKIISAENDSSDFFTEKCLKYERPEVGSVCNLVILHLTAEEFDDSLSFWAADYFRKHFVRTFYDLRFKINLHCRFSCRQPHRPRPRELCLVKFEDNWHRAVANESTGDHFDVYFVDCGNSHKTKAKFIRKMKEKFLQVPVFACKFAIEGSNRFDGRSDLKEAIFDFLKKKYMRKKLVEVEVRKYERETFHVRIPEVDAIIAKLNRS